MAGHDDDVLQCLWAVREQVSPMTSDNPILYMTFRGIGQRPGTRSMTQRPQGHLVDTQTL
jgi:hypothetical protein